MAISTQQEIYDAFIVELQSQRSDLTDTQIGSIIDLLAGVISTAVTEITKVSLDEYKKTFFDTANGPEITGSTDDLQTLAVDHFGDSFARPGAVKATGTVTFSRPTAGAGNIVIPAGTIVKTPINANGTSERFQTEASVTMVGLTINSSVTALTAGPSANAQPGTVTEIETTLLDSTITVTNSGLFAGGEDAESDSEYRETIRSLLASLKGSTLDALVAKALTVGGVEFAVGLEALQYVKEWNIGTNVVSGEYFGIPRAKIYIADSNGTASQVLITNVQTAINSTRAAGVKVEVIGAIALVQNWTASISLNPAGPNYATLQSNTQMIKDVMKKYIQDMPIGKDFIKSTAKTDIMAIFGPSGSNDLTNFTISVPSGDVSVADNQKLIPGSMVIS